MRFDPEFSAASSLRDLLKPAEEPTAAMFGAMKAAEPALKAVARTQLEWVKFAGQRGQAAMAVPSRLAACRTPHDLMTEQVRFWQTAFEQYAEATSRISAIWSNINPAAQMMAHHFDTWRERNAAAKATAIKPVADPITFREPEAVDPPRPVRTLEPAGSWAA